MKKIIGSLTRIVALLAVLSVLFLARRAEAGYYTRTYSGGTLQYAGQVLPYSQLGPDTWGKGTSYYSSVTASGMITATFVWVPNPQIPNELPPPRVFLKETSSAHHSNSSLHPGATTGQVANGLGHPEINGVSGGSLYRTHWNPGYQFTVKCTPSASTLSGYASVSYSVIIVNKGVLVTRAGARGEWADTEGNLHGDTTRSYIRWFTLPSNDPGVPNLPQSIEVWNWQQFNSSFIGEWSTHIVYDSDRGTQQGGYHTLPDVDWAWNPAHSTAKFDWNKWSMLFGQQYKDEDSWKETSGAPLDRILTYRATDRQDGATAEAKYHLRIHDNYEDLQINHVMEQLNVQIVGQEIANFSPDPREVSGGAIEIADSHGVSISFNAEVEPSKFAAWSFGFSPSYEYTWTRNIVSAAVGITLPSRHYTYLEEYESYKHYTGTVEEFDSAGYVGRKTVDFRVRSNPPFGVRYHLPTIPLSGNAGGGGGMGGG